MARSSRHPRRCVTLVLESQSDYGSQCSQQARHTTPGDPGSRHKPCHGRAEHNVAQRQNSLALCSVADKADRTESQLAPQSGCVASCVVGWVGR
jgi:hypothetical protein